MQQEDVERFAFLYLCSEHDRKLLKKEETMTWEDFERLTYLTCHFGLMALHTEIWAEYAWKFEKKLECLENIHMKQEIIVDTDEQEKEFSRREQWIREFCQNAPDGLKEWLEDLDDYIVINN